MASLIHPGPERRRAESGIDGPGPLNGNGSRRSSSQGCPLQIRPLQVGPGKACHKGIPCAGGIDRLRRTARQQQSSLVAGGINSLSPQGDEHPAQARVQQHLSRPVQAPGVRNGHAGQKLGLYAVGLQGVDFPQNGPQLLRLDRRHRVYKKGRLQAYLADQEELLRRALQLAWTQEDLGPKYGPTLEENLRQLESLRACRTWEEVRTHQITDFGRLAAVRKPRDPDLAERIKALRKACWEGVKARQAPFAVDSQRLLADLDQSHLALQGLVQLVRDFARVYEREKRRRRARSPM